ncbi:MAG: hypothetical protein U1E09_08655 [Methylococcales bacterium]|jgi:hypothetical protein|nr:hypothetical protein [Methylococcaceae bacterium]MDP2394756.1 hypothetical protein [Methylococcaceae bacterium]MDZ4156606.1 hypothetical protein [Methylococcales bacterium]
MDNVFQRLDTASRDWQPIDRLLCLDSRPCFVLIFIFVQSKNDAQGITQGWDLLDFQNGDQEIRPLGKGMNTEFGAGC